MLILTTQEEVHDPVNTIKRINEFSWTMTKLKILICYSLDESYIRLTNLTKFLKEVTDRKWGVEIPGYYSPILSSKFKCAFK